MRVPLFPDMPCEIAKRRLINLFPSLGSETQISSGVIVISSLSPGGIQIISGLASLLNTQLLPPGLTFFTANIGTQVPIYYIWLIGHKVEIDQLLYAHTKLTCYRLPVFVTGFCCILS
jgi:hypothetical protein